MGKERQDNSMCHEGNAADGVVPYQMYRTAQNQRALPLWWIPVSRVECLTCCVPVLILEVPGASCGWECVGWECACVWGGEIRGVRDEWTHTGIPHTGYKGFNPAGTGEGKVGKGEGLHSGAGCEP